MHRINCPFITVKPVTGGDQETALTWSAVSASPAVDGYKIYYGKSTGKYTWVVDVGNVTEYELDTWSGTFYVACTAYNADGESGYSNEITITPGS